MKVFTVRMDESLIKLIKQAQAKDQKRVDKEFGLGLKVTRTGMIRFLVQEGLSQMGIK